MFSEFLARFHLDDVAFFLADIFLDIIVVVYLAEEANALRVVTLRAWQFMEFRQSSHFRLWYVTDWEHRF